MMRHKLIEVNGKKEQPVDGKVVITKPETDSEEDFIKKTVQFYSCKPEKSVTYEVVGKCNTVQLMDSSGCTLSVDTVVSGVEITNCTDVTVIVKDGQECWTANLNKCHNVTIILNDTIMKGGAEFIAAGSDSFKKDFQVIGAAISKITVQRGSKSLVLPSCLEFKVDMSGPTVTHSPFKGKLPSPGKGVEMEPEGAGLAIGDKAKGKTVIAANQKGKGKDLPLSVTGAANTVVLDGCQRVALDVAEVKKDVHVLASKQVKMKANGTLPRVIISHTHGCYITLATVPSEFIIVAEHYSDVNMNFPYGANSEKKELSLKEQFVYKFENDVVTYEEPTF